MATPKKTKKSSKAKAAPPSVKSRLFAFLPTLKTALVDLTRGLVSRDGPTLRMSWLFFLSLIGMVTVIFLASQRLQRFSEIEAQRRAELAALEAQKEKEARQAEEKKHQASQITLGRFVVKLKPETKKAYPKSTQHEAEVEVVLLCDTPVTRDWIETNMVKVRNEVLNVIASLDRDQMLGKTGKKVLKRQLVERLNAFLPQGKILDLFFPSLLVT